MHTATEKLQRTLKKNQKKILFLQQLKLLGTPNYENIKKRKIFKSLNLKNKTSTYNSLCFAQQRVTSLEKKSFSS